MLVARKATLAIVVCGFFAPLIGVWPVLAALGAVNAGDGCR
jgi:hypothetical protein